jgi:hypothetical protein
MKLVHKKILEELKSISRAYRCKTRVILAKEGESEVKSYF